MKYAQRRLNHVDAHGEVRRGWRWGHLPRRLPHGPRRGRHRHLRVPGGAARALFLLPRVILLYGGLYGDLYGRPRYFPPQARLVERFDRLGDGRLHYHEFVRMLSATRAEQHDDPVPAIRPHEAPADELARLQVKYHITRPLAPPYSLRTVLLKVESYNDALGLQLENARMQNAALKVRHHELEQAGLA